MTGLEIADETLHDSVAVMRELLLQEQQLIHS
jgi:hypothetical protein